MDIRIIKQNVRYCTVCNEVSELKKSWEEGQKLLVENEEQEEEVQFPGVPGYLIKDTDDYKFGYMEVCEKCMKTLMHGVSLIESNNLTGISLDSNNIK